jgi:hypothetical protein
MVIADVVASFNMVKFLDLLGGLGSHLL